MTATKSSFKRRMSSGKMYAGSILLSCVSYWSGWVLLEFCPIPEQFPNRRLKYFEDLFFLDLSLTCQLPQDILKEFFVHWTLLCRCRMLLTVCRRVQRSLQPGRLWFTLSNLSTFRPTAPRRIFRTECKWNPVDPGVDPRGGPPGWTPGVDPRGGPPG